MAELRCRATTRRGTQCAYKHLKGILYCGVHQRSFAKTGSGKRAAGVTESARHAEALRLKMAGHTYDQIAAAIGYTERGGAFKAVQSALDEQIPVEDVAKYRAIENARLESLQAAYWADAIGVDADGSTIGADGFLLTPTLRSAEMVLSIMVRRARLLGIDRPITAEPPSQSESDAEDAERRALVTETVIDKMEQLRVKVAAQLNSAS